MIRSLAFIAACGSAIVWAPAPDAGIPVPLLIAPNDHAVQIGADERPVWDGCRIDIDLSTGDVRIRGERREKCIDALDAAVRIARAEDRVNHHPKKK